MGISNDPRVVTFIDKAKKASVITLTGITSDALLSKTALISLTGCYS